MSTTLERPVETGTIAPPEPTEETPRLRQEATFAWSDEEVVARLGAPARPEPPRLRVEWNGIVEQPEIEAVPLRDDPPRLREPSSIPNDGHPFFIESTPGEGVTFQPIPQSPRRLFDDVRALYEQLRGAGIPTRTPRSLGDMYQEYEASMKAAGMTNYLSADEFMSRVCYCSGPRSGFIRP